MGMAMNKSNLIETLAKKNGLSIRQAEQIVNIFFDTIADGLADGGRAEIRGFAAFNVKNYEGYQGRNPKSGELIQVPPKKLPFFKPGKELRERVDLEGSD